MNLITPASLSGSVETPLVDATRDRWRQRWGAFYQAVDRAKSDMSGPIFDAINSCDRAGEGEYSHIHEEAATDMRRMRMALPANAPEGAREVLLALESMFDLAAAESRAFEKAQGWE